MDDRFSSDGENEEGKNKSDDDENEDDNDEEEEQKGRMLGFPIRKKKQKEPAVVVDQKSDDLFELVHGNKDDIQQLNLQMATYDSAAWAELADQILRVTVDSSMSDQQVMITFHLMNRLFCHSYKDEYSVVDRVKAIYSNTQNMKDQFNRLQKTFGSIHFELLRRNLIDNTSLAGRELEKMLTMVAFGMKMSFQQAVHNKMLLNMGDAATRTILDELSPLAFFTELDTQKLKPAQKLMHFYYKQAFENSYRKLGEQIHRPKHNKFGDFVYAFEYVYDISEFVFQSVFPIEQNHFWFDCLTSSPATPKQCINMLTNLKCEWLPDLERNPDIHSYENGLYVLSLDKFYYFKEKPGKHNVRELVSTGMNMVAIKYNDMEFDEEGMEREMTSMGGRNFMLIKMDPIYQILNVQDFSAIECMWIFGLLGRMMHPLGKMDNWSVFLYFLGLAGTGKSSLLRLLASLFNPTDVGFLNNELQRTFSIEGIADKLVYFALDIDEHFGLDQATFQSMVCGEEVSVLRKYKTPVTTVWKSHGGFAGNKLPPWTDNGGSLSRRLVIVEFMRIVKKVDPALFQNCLKLKDRFLKVINAAYHYLTEKHAGSSIKDVMPPKFRESEKKALLELNILSSFIKDNCELEPEPTKPSYFASFKEFTTAFKDYCKRNNHPNKTFNYSFYSGVFCKINCVVVEPKQNDPFQQTANYIKGLKLKDTALQMSN